MPLPQESLELTTILNTREKETAETWNLVLMAVQIPHKIKPDPSGWLLQIPPELEHRTLYELDCYFQENKNWPPRPVPIEHSFVPLIEPPTIFLMGLLMLFYGITGPWSEHSIWFLQGAADSEAILLKHQWWRLLTALTLHADLVHLLGNCLIGGFIIHFFCRIIGNGLGLLAIILTGTIGNYINITIHGPGHLSVGLSTAVFAVIGMLAMLNHHRNIHNRWLSILMPFMAGAALLAMLGASGERTDLGAHFFGLLAGLGAGAVLRTDIFLQWRHSMLLQFICIILSIFLIIGCWQIALHQT